MKHSKGIIVWFFSVVVWMHASLAIPCNLYQVSKEMLAHLIYAYEERLGIYKNPFLYSITVDQAYALYATFLKRSGNETPLSKIQNELKEIDAQRTFNRELFNEILDDAQTLLENKASKKHDLQSNLLALQALAEYTEHFALCTQGEEHEKENDNDRETEDKPSDEYTPHTKTSYDQEKPKERVAQVNFHTPFLNHALYINITRTSLHPFKTNNDFWNANTYDTDDSKNLIVKTLGKKHLILLLPPGYIPVKVLEEEVYIKDQRNGSYSLALEKEYTTVTIALKKLKAAPLTQLQHEITTQPVGFTKEEWPDDIQAHLINVYHKDSNHAATIAKAVADHIKVHYTYAKEALPEKDPIDALKRGSFQCDMAAYIMVSILRDLYAIPCRVAAGYHAQQDSSASYVELPDAPHMWVEVFYDNEWHIYDPTPLRSDNKEHQTEHLSEGYNSLHDTTKNQTHQATEQNTKSMFSLQTQEDHSLSPLDLQSNYQVNPLKHHLLELLCAYTFNPLLSSDEVLFLLNTWKHILKNDTQKDFLDEGELLHKEPHRALFKQLQKLNQSLFSQKITSTYKEVTHMVALLKHSLHCAYKKDIISTVYEIIKELSHVLEILKTLEDKVPLDRILVEEFKDSCSPLVWQAVIQDYQLENEIDIKHLANDIKAGKLNDKLLLNYVYKYSNFILGASLKPAYSSTKAWSGNTKRGNDIVLAQRLSDWNKVITTQPGKDLFESIAQGQAYMMAKRKNTISTKHKTIDEEERITIVGFDTSGSMAGDCTLFQGALIAAFISRALSDISPQGNQRHRVVLVPFNHKIGKPINVTHTQAALYVIKKYQQILRNTKGGTDIQTFLLYALELIARAQNDGSSFDGANIIVITDGQSKIDYTILRKAREAINRKTPLQTMFIALGNSNSELRQFALDSEKIGAQAGFYHEFSASDIARIIKEISTLHLEKNVSQYYSNRSPQDIPPSAQTHAQKAIKKAEVLTKQMHEYLYQAPYSSFVPLLKSHRQKNVHTTKELEAWVLQVRQFITEHKALHNDTLLNFLLGNLLERFQSLTGVPLEHLSYKENAQLVHLFEKPY